MKTSWVVLLFAARNALADVFPPPRGPYAVQWTSSELVDESRLDPFNGTHLRRIMVSHFTPIEHEHCQAQTVPYMPAQVAALEDAILVEYLGGVYWPEGVLAGLEIQTCRATCNTTSKQDFPTILLGSGLNTTRLFYSATAQQLASMGYRVITMDHPYETDVVLFPNGDIIFSALGPVSPNNTAPLEFALDVRTQDVTNETRIAGGLNLDGGLWGDVQYTGVERPFLVVGSMDHNSTTDESWSSFFDAMDEKHSEVWLKELSVRGALHGSYCDFSLIGDVTGLRENQDLEQFFFGTITGERVMEVMREYISDYVDFTLGGSDEGFLAGPSSDFPEVEFLR
ncbi:hypothetical protein B0I35DRAFT_488226 [Stachybotrys elegans]|uniref:1-alkyl-2-acetylglycerophosphocholine esterase n=1 Tax=Stachybotrys elegans TaxID=80388 RepID=A0A8K0SNI7_9HYPO|nr:hypothetical protein B0I35DRAFT_488226 [Stachybotrys elegans]